MAIDWGGGLSGAGTGAAIGASFGNPWTTAIGAGLGGLGGLFFGGEDTQAVGGPEDVQNVNPYTDAFYQRMQGLGENSYDQLMGSMGGGNQFYPGMQQAIGGIDPNAAQNYFMNNAAGGYRDIAEQNFDQFNTANQEVADRMSNQAVQNISSQFANRGPGSMRSGAAMGAISEGAINPLLQSNAQIAQMVGGQAGQLQGQGMNNLFNAYNTANQQRLAGMGQLMSSADQRAMADQSTLAGIYGQAMGAQTGIADPWIYNQEYMDNPNAMGFGDALTAGSEIGGMLSEIDWESMFQ